MTQVFVVVASIVIATMIVVGASYGATQLDLYLPSLLNSWKEILAVGAMIVFIPLVGWRKRRARKG